MFSQFSQSVALQRATKASRSVSAKPEAAGGAVAVAGAGASVAVGAAPDPGVSVGGDAVRSGPVTPDGSSEPQAASAAVRARVSTTLNRITYLVVRVLVIFFRSRS